MNLTKQLTPKNPQKYNTDVGQKVQPIKNDHITSNFFIKPLAMTGISQMSKVEKTSQWQMLPSIGSGAYQCFENPNAAPAVAVALLNQTEMT